MVAWVFAILLGVSIGIVIDRACEWLSEDINKDDKKSELNSKFGYVDTDKKSELNSKFGYVDTDMFDEYKNISEIDITHMYPEIKKINEGEDNNDES